MTRGKVASNFGTLLFINVIFAGVLAIFLMEKNIYCLKIPQKTHVSLECLSNWLYCKLLDLHIRRRLDTI